VLVEEDTAAEGAGVVHVVVGVHVGVVHVVAVVDAVVVVVVEVEVGVVDSSY